MEDRHYLSEPRPILNNNDESTTSGPAWEVDVFRQGVDFPIETLRIDNSTLPPRRNPKTKKVVWKLPSSSSSDHLPHFGAAEKKRILELFKQRRKENRKRKSKKQGSNNNEGSSKNGTESGGGEEEGQQQQQQQNGDQYQDDDDDNDDETADTQNDGAITKAGSGSRQPKDEKASSSELQSPPMLRAAPQSMCPPPPQGIIPARPPPGFDAAALALDLERHHLNDAVVMGEEEPSPCTTTAHAAMPVDVRNASAGAADAALSPTSQLERYLVVPAAAVTSSTTTSVHLARQLVDIYYPLVTLGQAEELASYFMKTAQKSISVGGAHAVVNCGAEVVVQLGSLKSTQFVVRGVVAQDGIAGSVVLLITGLVVQQPQQLSSAAADLLQQIFCHSITLVPSSSSSVPQQHQDSYCYQIQNDALAFLGPASSSSMPPPPPDSSLQHAATSDNAAPAAAATQSSLSPSQATPSSGGGGLFR